MEYAAPGMPIGPNNGAPLPPRPPMPTWVDQNRSVHTATREQILSEDWEQVILEWLKAHVGEDRVALMGPPDISANPLADLSRQLSTPGLYGVRPASRHLMGAEDFIGPGGWLDRAGHWTKAQHVQYMTLGAGDWVIRIDASPELGLTERLVSPANVYVVAHPDLPDKPTRLWELRLRWWAEKNCYVYAWDMFDTGKPDMLDANPRAPSYRIALASMKMGDLGDDVSQFFLRGPDGNPAPAGGLVGDRYPYRDRASKPFLPFSIYRAEDSGLPWNTYAKRGAHRGTLNTALYWTYTGHAAKSASGRAVIAVGLEPMGDVRQPAGPNQGARVRSMTLLPGSIAYHAPLANSTQQPLIVEIGPGADLQVLAEFTANYEMRQAVRWGLNPTDVTRGNSSPTSGAALFISAKGKRDFSAQVLEVFRKADMETIRIASNLLRLAGLGDFPEDGYSITYHEIPESPEEQKDERDQIDWEVDHGLLSELEAYQRIHPGATAEDAMAAIVKARVDTLAVDAEVRKRAEGLGLFRTAGTEAAGTAGTAKEAASAEAIAADAKAGKIDVQTARGLLGMFFGIAEIDQKTLVPDAPAETTEPDDADAPAAAQALAVATSAAKGDVPPASARAILKTFLDADEADALAIIPDDIADEPAAEAPPPPPGAMPADPPPPPHDPNAPPPLPEPTP